MQLHVALVASSARCGDPEQCNSIIYANFVHLSANSLQKRSGCSGNNGHSLIWAWFGNRPCLPLVVDAAGGATNLAIF